MTHATRPDTVVTCSAAEWICAADPQCATALDYYNRFCGAMFRGRRCTDRCRNSIRILKRQSAAAKLESCRCTGDERYDCDGIKNNMERLCYGRPEESNEIDDERQKSGGGFRLYVEKLLLLLCLFVNAVVSLLMSGGGDAGGGSGEASAR